MKIIAKNGEFITEELTKKAQASVTLIEESSRLNPPDSVKYPVGFVIPLGTLGNAPNQSTQFKSNFHVVAYNSASELLDKDIDFEAFNIGDRVQDNGHISKLTKALDLLAEHTFGPGWRITVFNVKLNIVIESMCKGVNDVDVMKRAMDDFYNIVNGRVEQLKKATQENPWGHEVIELYYAPLRAISIDFAEMISITEQMVQLSNEPKAGGTMRGQQATKLAKKEVRTCNGVQIRTLVYDEYANGLRMLTNLESFTSSKIRVHTESDSEIYLFVLKARVVGDDINFKPIRQFAGKSVISYCEVGSGCVKRIVYNIINKNYTQWSFISIPPNLRVDMRKIETKIEEPGVKK